jgi:GxxExxY protein
MELADLSDRVIRCAIEVHRCLGPGLLESAYSQCLAYELAAAGITFEREKAVGVTYKEVQIDCGFRLDMLVENCMIVELKATDRLLPIHRAQLLTYLRISKMKVGLLINFNSRVLKDGLLRLVL